MTSRNYFNSVRILSIIYLLSISNSYSNSFMFTSNCKNNSAYILLSNTLDQVALIDIILETDSKYSKATKISKHIAPGGMQTICIAKEVVFTNIIPCLRSYHSEHTNIYYTFDHQHDGNEPLASITITDDKIYPTII